VCCRDTPGRKKRPAEYNLYSHFRPHSNEYHARPPYECVYYITIKVPVMALMISVVLAAPKDRQNHYLFSLKISINLRRSSKSNLRYVSRHRVGHQTMQRSRRKFRFLLPPASLLLRYPAHTHTHTHTHTHMSIYTTWGGGGDRKSTFH